MVVVGGAGPWVMIGRVRVRVTIILAPLFSYTMS
jgi:hypothetical protein